MLNLSYGDIADFDELNSETETDFLDLDFFFNSSSLWDPVLNLSNGPDYYDVQPETEARTSAYTNTILTVSSAGILVNLFFLALIVADFTVNRRRQKHLWSRHWLLLNLCVAHLVSLVTVVVQYGSTRGYGHLSDALDCTSLMHILYGGPFTTSLGLCLVVIHACMSVLRPSFESGKVSVIVFLSAVVLSWLATHIGTYFLVTEFTVEDKTSVTEAGRHYCYIRKTKDEYMDIFYLMVVFPYSLFCVLVMALLCIVAFSSLKRNKPPNAGTSSGHTVSVSDQAPELANRKCQNVCFICVAFLIAVLLRLPVNFYLLPEFIKFLDRFEMVVSGFYILTIMAQTSFVLIPLSFLILPEIRSIFTSPCRKDDTIEAA